MQITRAHCSFKEDLFLTKHGFPLHQKIYTPPEKFYSGIFNSGSNYAMVLSIHNPNTNGCPGSYGSDRL
jgi:hypothetical protein